MRRAVIQQFNMYLLILELDKKKQISAVTHLSLTQSLFIDKNPHSFHRGD